MESLVYFRMICHRHLKYLRQNSISMYKHDDYFDFANERLYILDFSKAILIKWSPRQNKFLWHRLSGLFLVTAALPVELPDYVLPIVLFQLRQYHL